MGALCGLAGRGLRWRDITPASQDVDTVGCSGMELVFDEVRARRANEILVEALGHAATCGDGKRCHFVPASGRVLRVVRPPIPARHG